MFANSSSVAVATASNSAFSSSSGTWSLSSIAGSSSLSSGHVSTSELSHSTSTRTRSVVKAPILLTTSTSVAETEPSSHSAAATVSSSFVPPSNSSIISSATGPTTSTFTSTVSSHVNTHSNLTTAPPSFQSAPSSGFAPTLGINGTGSLNSTNGSADAYADACNSASISFLSKYGTLTSTTTGTGSTVTYFTYTFVPPNTTAYTTLCDGYPRAHGNPYYAPVTLFDFVPDVDYFSTWDPAVATPPACTINQAQCTRLYNSWDYKESDRPACSYSDPGCTTSASTCYIAAQSVQMAYWPVSVTGDLCGNRTTVPPTVTTPQTATVFGTTVVSPNVLMSFDQLVLNDGCSNPVSTVTNYVLEQRPDQISSQQGSYHAGYNAGSQVNFANFQSPVPASAYLGMQMCGGGGGGAPTYCSTIWDVYTPELAIPTAVMDIPGFAGCGFFDDGNLVFDPPIALTAVANEAVPTLPGGSTPTSATALPEKTPSPTLPPATSTKPVEPPSEPSPSKSDSADSPAPPAQSSPHKSTPADDPAQPSPSPNDPPKQNGPSSPSNSNENSDPSSPSNSNDDPDPSSPSNPNDNSDPSFPSSPNQNSDPSSPSNSNDNSDPSPQPAPESPSTTSRNVGGIVASAIGASPAPADQNGGGSSPDQQSQSSNQQQPGQPDSSNSGGVTTVGNIPISAAPGSSAVVIDGTATLTPGQSTMIHQTPVAVGSSGQVIVGSSTVNLASPSQGGNSVNGAVLNLGGSIVTASSLSGGSVVLQGQTLAPGQTAVVDGQTVSVGSAGIAMNGATKAFSPVGSDPTPTSVAIITAGGQTFTAQASDGTVVVGGTTLTPGQVATINGQVVSDASSGLVVNDQTALFNADLAASGQAVPMTAVMNFGSQTITATESSGTAIINGATLTPGQVTTMDGHTISDISSGLVVDGTTSLWSGGSGPVTQVMQLENQDVTVTESSGTATIDSSVTLTPGETTTLDGHTVTDVSSGLVIDGQTTSLFADATTTDASMTVITIGSHTYTATDEGDGVLVVSGHTLSPGSVATIDGQTISDASGKIVQATPAFSSLGGDAARPSASPSTGGAASERVAVVALMGAIGLAIIAV